VDPFAVLGIAPGVPPEEVAAAYRRAAKRWHPDLAGAAGDERMAEINAAYELLRSGQWQRQHRQAPPVDAERVGETVVTGRAAPRRRARAGDWLPEAVRRALGPELLSVLEPGEEVSFVAPVSLWASPQALLAVTDRRLLWLNDDAVTGRVRSLPYAAVTGVETRLAWPRRRTAAVRVHRRTGRALTFSDLRPQTAEAIARRLRQGVAR
jgi:hypothetical protein